MLIIPDVHGRSFWSNPVKDAIQNNEPIIFLGDYVDPYGYEGISNRQAFGIFKRIVGIKKEHPELVILLLGNHDLHYVDSRLWGSRYDYLNSEAYKSLILDNADLFQITFTVSSRDAQNKVLFTHAGLLQCWFLNHRNIFGNVPLENVPQILNDYWADSSLRPSLIKTLADIPYCRGGKSLYGSPIWSDIDDFEDAEEIPGYYQIFGHSQQESDPVIGDHCACLDCRHAFHLNIDTLIITKV